MTHFIHNIFFTTFMAENHLSTDVVTTDNINTNFRR
jgi:hypothetical protein